jgi:hypothetical protein
MVAVVTIGLAVSLSDRVSAQSATATPTSQLSPYGLVTVDPTQVSGAASAEQAAPAAVNPQPSAKRGEFVFAPLPVVNPTLDNGLAGVVGYLYRVDRTDLTTAPSATALAGFKTSNGSWAGAVLQSLHLAHDRFRVLAIGGYGDINYPFYGIGHAAGDAGVSLELNQVGPAGLIEGLVRMHPRWYVGARYQILRMSVSTDAIPLPNGPTLPSLDGRLRTAALGPRVEFDSRDSTFYPTSGWQLQGIGSFYGKTIGGQRDYQVYQVWTNHYQAVGTRHVFAWHVGACGAAGSVPFYDLCLLGKSQDLRGYTVGQYRDRAMVAGQGEWRSNIWWRFGAVAFVGAGEVADSFGSLTWNNVLPGGGAGVRFVLAERNHVNLRVDYAWGQSSRALYVGVLEAF